MFHAVRTSRGWELADESGTLEPAEISVVFPTKKAAQEAANEANFKVRGFDELAAMELRYD